MDFLSESQMKLINDFKERVKQSEKRLSETLHETEITIGPSTPGLMPYIGMNDDASRLSEPKYGKYDAGSNEIMIQDMSPQKATPPQKHLSTFIFNESQSGPHSDEQRLDTFDPQINVSAYPQNTQKVGKGRYDIIVSRESQDLIDPRGNVYRPTSFSGASHPLRDSMTTKSNYIQSSQASNHDPVDEAYRREIGVQDTEQTEEGKGRIEEGQQEDEEDGEGEEHHENEGEYEHQEHEENSYFDHQRQYQMMYGGSLHSYPMEEGHNMSGQDSTMFYGNKLDEYLKSQQKTQSSFAFERPNILERGEREERIEGTDHYFYHMGDERRRLKVPSIRYFEDGHVSPLKKKIIEDKYREIRNYSSVEKERQENPLYEERGILSHQDQNTSGSFHHHHHQNRLALNNTQPVKKKPVVGTPKKGLSSTATKGLKTQKSVKSITNKRQNIENIKGKENTLKKPKERKTGGGGGERGRPQTSVPPGRKTENIKLRPLTRSPHPSGANKAVKKEIVHHHHQEEPENERRELAKDILRKCRLGTIDQNQFIFLLEDHMHVSANFFERLKDLANK